MHGTFEWSEQLQSFILGSFYIGYVLMYGVGPFLVYWMGPKTVAVFAQFATIVLTILTPVIVQGGGAAALISLRLLLGCVQGGYLSAVNVILTKWIPLNQCARMTMWIFYGLPVSACCCTDIRIIEQPVCSCSLVLWWVVSWRGLHWTRLPIIGISYFITLVSLAVFYWCFS